MRRLPNAGSIRATWRSRLKEHGDAQALLRAAEQHAQIYRFELVEPSLEEIFIRTVGEKVDA